MPSQHEKSVVERVLHGSAGFPGGGTAFGGRPGSPVVAPWRPFISRKGAGDRLWPFSPYLHKQPFSPALEMRGRGPSQVGFFNQDIAPPQPFQPTVKRVRS